MGKTVSKADRADMRKDRKAGIKEGSKADRDSKSVRAKEYKGKK